MCKWSDFYFPKHILILFNLVETFQSPQVADGAAEAQRIEGLVEATE